MDSNGRQQSPAPAPVAIPVPSSSTSTPSTSTSTSTFRRLPSLARPFRRNPDKEKEKEKERIKEESTIREEEVDINTSTSTSTNGHSRTLTFPSLSLARVLGDSSSSTPTTLNANTTNRQTDESTKPTPSRTSSLPQTNDQNPPPLSPFPQKGSMREAMVSTLAPPVPILSSQSMGDMEPITYPSHLAQRLPPEIGAGPSSTTSTPPPAAPSPAPAPAQGSLYSTPTLAPSWARIGRSRETTNSSTNTNTTTILITPGRNGVHDEGGNVQRRDDRIPLANLDYIGPEPGPGGPPTGVPRRKESIGIQVDHHRGQVNGDSRADQVNGQKNSGTDTDSGDGMQRRKRATTKSAVDRPRTDTTPNEKESTTTPSSGDKSQDASTRTRKTSKPKTPHTISQPSLPSAKPMSRVAASSMYFSLLPFHGRPPTQALRAHTGTLVGNRIWMIGGVDSKHCWRGVAWYDTESLLWSTIETGGETLPPLRAHTTTAVGTKLYIFGGGDGPTYSNDVWLFDTDTPKQSLPPPRRAHTTVLYRKFLVILGGGNGQTALNDIWALDISDPTRLTWEEWPTQGEAPARKGYHTANLVGDKMIVFGGSDGHASFADVHVLNLKNLQWTTVITDVKHNRLSHTSTQVGSYLFILGGHNGQSYAQDVLLFNLVTLQWESKIPKGQAPPGRGYHVALLHDARIFISGGYNGVAVFDDLWSLDLSAAAYLPQVTTFEVDETRSLGFTHDA